MKKTYRWKKKSNGEITSLDGYVIISQEGDQWKMVDSIDGIEELYKTQKEALDAGAEQMMVSDLGNFNVFLPILEKNGDLIFVHQIF